MLLARNYFRRAVVPTRIEGIDIAVKFTQKNLEPALALKLLGN